MPFCTSCGAEISADNKFCTSCGAPMDQLVGPVTPGHPLPVQPVPAEKPKIPKKTLLIIGIVAVLVILAAAYVAGVPMLKAVPSQQPVPATVPGTPARHVTTYVQPSKTSIIPPTAVTPQQTFEIRYGDSYEQVYTLTRDFSFGEKKVFTQEITRPPLYIKFNLTPDNITREKVINIGLASEETINTTYPSPNAWFEVKVLDAGTGAVIDKRGFHKEYSEMTKQEFMVRKQGNYQVEISGNDVLAEVRILIGTA